MQLHTVNFWYLSCERPWALAWDMVLHKIHVAGVLLEESMELDLMLLGEIDLVVSEVTAFFLPVRAN